MSSLAFNMRNGYLSIYVFIFSPWVLASEFTSPESTAIGFYKEYLNDDSKNNELIVSEYVSEKLMKSINDSTMCNYDSNESISDIELESICSKKHECKEYKGNYLCDWYGIWIESDVNYFTKSQDVYPSWKSNIKTSTVIQKEKESVINVFLGDGTEPTSTLRVTLTKNDNNWKIISVTE